MMRLDDSREAGLLAPSTQYSSLETSMRMSEFDVPMGGQRRPKSRSRFCYVVGVCIALIAVAAIVGVSVGKTNNGGDGQENDDDSTHHKLGPRGIDASAPTPAPAPVEEEAAPPPGVVGSSPPAPPLATTEPVASPPEPAQSTPPLASPPAPPSNPPLASLAPAPYSSSYDNVRYETICNKTIDSEVCNNLFASNPNSAKVDFQQWTIMTMEASEQALNESYTIAMTLRDPSYENVALEQCIDVFSEALVLLNESMYVLADMDVHNPGAPAADIQVALNAAMTDHDTCQDGIDDVGSFPGSDRITGVQGHRVDTLLSISLTFFNELLATADDPNRHRRRLLLHLQSFLGRRALLDSQPPGRTSLSLSR